MNLDKYILYVTYFFTFLISMPFHELAHACVANFLGDDTAKKIGRMSINPAKHIDIIGFFCLFKFGFGWAKPVPIDLQKFSKPKRDMALVSLAGPISNLFLALMGASIYKLLVAVCDFGFCVLFISNLGLFFYYFTVVNVNLAVFNLIPIPPLDGSRIFMSFLPDRQYNVVLFLEKFGGIFILLLTMSRGFNNFILFCSSKVLGILDFLTSGFVLNLSHIILI